MGDPFSVLMHVTDKLAGILSGRKKHITIR